MSAATMSGKARRQGGVRSAVRRWLRGLGAASVAPLCLAAAPLAAQVDGGGTPPLDAAALARAVAAQERHQAALFARPGVAGVGVTLHKGEPALLVLIAKGKDRPALPLAVDGVPVVVELGFEASLINGGSCLPCNSVRCTPCHADQLPLPVEMGNSTSSDAVCAACKVPCDAGTLGFKVCDPQTRTLGYVTAGHVATRGPDFCPGTAPNGTHQRHRGQLDASAPGCPTESTVGTLERFVPLQPYPAENLVDAAFVASTAAQTSASIRDIGLPHHTIGPWALNTCVWKSGRSSGLTPGRTVAVHVTVNFTDGCELRRWAHLFRIAPDESCGPCLDPPCHRFAVSGDSGAAVVSGTTTKKIAGLLFANMSGPNFSVHGLAQPVEFVLSALGVSLDLSECQ